MVLHYENIFKLIFLGFIVHICAFGKNITFHNLFVLLQMFYCIIFVQFTLFRIVQNKMRFLH